MDILKLIPERYRFWTRDNEGNVLVGDNVVEVQGSKVKDNTLVGNNKVKSKARPGQPVLISGNKLFGKNKIIITDGEIDEDPDN